MECTKEIVNVQVTASLIDMAARRTVFTSAQGGTTEREDCYNVAEYPYTNQ